MANTLAYYDTAEITAVKSFIVQAPGVENWTTGACSIKKFMAVIYRFSLKDRVFIPGKLFQPSLMLVDEARGLP
jgi:hypothetical protein